MPYKDTTLKMATYDSKSKYKAHSSDFDFSLVFMASISLWSAWCLIFSLFLPPLLLLLLLLHHLLCTNLLKDFWRRFWTEYGSYNWEKVVDYASIILSIIGSLFWWELCWNNRLVCKVSFSTCSCCCTAYSIEVNAYSEQHTSIRELLWTGFLKFAFPHI